MAFFDNIFGFRFQKSKKEIQQIQQTDSFVPPTNEDGAATVEGGLRNSYLDLDGTIRNEFDLITRYREMSLHPEMDTAIEQIVNEAICIEENTPPVKISFKKPEDSSADVLTKGMKDVIEKEFNNIIKLLDFNTQAYDIFRRWYIDGRLYFHAVTQNGKEKEGIKELRYIDPRQIKKIRVTENEKDEITGVELIKIVEEFYAFNQRGMVYPNSQNTGFGGTGIVNGSNVSSITGIKISKDCITYIHSGLTDRYSSTVISHLHKAIRPLNQLKMMEDASVIYRLVRAPERRIFYIDVMDMPQTKANQYMREIMQKTRNKLVYDPSTGDVKDDRRFLTTTEDFWLPMRNGSSTTKIDTLKGGENLGEVRDIEYFLKKLYKSVNVPVSRMDPATSYNVGRATEISRDEIGFSKFIVRLRNRFSMLFDDLLKKQLILKGHIKEENWLDIKDSISYYYTKDNFFAELKQQEILTSRFLVLKQADEYVSLGKYLSEHWVKKNILQQTDDEIAQMDKEIKKELKQKEPLEQPEGSGSKVNAYVSNKKSESDTPSRKIVINRNDVKGSEE